MLKAEYTTEWIDGGMWIRFHHYPPGLEVFGAFSKDRFGRTTVLILLENRADRSESKDNLDTLSLGTASDWIQEQGWSIDPIRWV